MPKLNGHPASAVHALEPRSLDSRSYGPEALTVIRQAFDEAGQAIAGNFGDDASRVAAARTRLANALLSIAKDQTRDVEQLKRDAMQIVARDCGNVGRRSPSFRPPLVSVRSCTNSAIAVDIFLANHPQMPRYEFRISDSGALVRGCDDEWQEFATLVAVHHEATVSAPGDTESGRASGNAATLDVAIVVLDEAGAIALTMPVGRVVGTDSQVGSEAR